MRIALHDGLTRTIGYLRSELGLRSPVRVEAVEPLKNGHTNGVVREATIGIKYSHRAVPSGPA